MPAGIYQIRNKDNGNRYIGSSINIDKRFREHKCALKYNKHHNSHLQRAYNKYSISSFSFEILEYCSEDELLKREDCWRATYNSNILYDMELISGRPNKGRIFSQASKKRMSDAQKKYNKKYGSHNKGLKRSMEMKQKLSEIFAKSFTVINPNGKVIKDSNIKQFCKNNNLCEKWFGQMLNGKRQHYRNWRLPFQPATI
jgi:group I intron endonuclease